MVTAGSSNCISCFDEWTTMGSGSTFCFPMKDCLPGTYRTTNDGSCILCNSGSFSVVNNSVSCTLCSPGKYSHDKGSSLCTPRCGPGFYSTNTGESTFFSDTCQTCPRNFDAPAGSTSPTNCTCSTGFFGPADGPCSPCPSGTYKAQVGTAAACTPCPVAGQWSPTQSVSPDDCMLIPTPAVSEACPRVPVEHFDEPRFKRCQTPWTWDNLYDGYKESTIDYYQGSLGMRSVPGIFESWACIRADPCALGPTDYFCYVWHEVNGLFVPWGSNTVLGIVPITSQDEVLHLRAEVNKLKVALNIES